MATQTPKGAVLLSSYPQHKILVDCHKCGIHAKYDKLDMLEAGGDRPLTILLDEIVRRKGCTKLDNIDMYDRCHARYSNMASSANAYEKAKSG